MPPQNIVEAIFPWTVDALMKLVNLKVLSLAFLVGMGFNGAARAQGTALLDADSLDEAAGMVCENSSILTAEMKECQERQSKQADTFRMMDYVWHGDNFDVLQVAQKMIASADAGAPQARAMLTMMQTGIAAAELSIRLKPEICTALVNEMISGSQDIKTTTPRAYAYLLAVYSRNAYMGARKQRNDVEVGCVKGYWNKGYRNFDKGLAFCRCTTELIYSALTKQERQAMFAHARGEQGAQDTAWMQKLSSKAQPCVAILRSVPVAPAARKPG